MKLPRIWKKRPPPKSKIKTSATIRNIDIPPYLRLIANHLDTTLCKSRMPGAALLRPLRNSSPTTLAGR